MKTLSKSKLLAMRQCQKRLWLEVHHPNLREDSTATQASFSVGYQVGEIAQKLYDPKGKGQLINAQDEGFEAAIARSSKLLSTSQPLFEAGFKAAGALAFADVLLPLGRGEQRRWRMVEVKSSTSVKDYHRDDIAIQAFVALRAGVPLSAVALAHIDSDWVYPGQENYTGLLIETDLTDEAFARAKEVKGWITQAQTIIGKRDAPQVQTGSHCSKPYECGFLPYCQKQEPPCKFPVSWLPRVQAVALKSHLEEKNVTDMRRVPNTLLNEVQLRVKTHTLANTVYFDKKNAVADLAKYKLPAYFLDFETCQFAVPIWKGTRPYQQIPFQFSLHRLGKNEKLSHTSFLDLTGSDPSKKFAEALIAACGTSGPLFVYNAGFETARIKELANRFPKLKTQLLALNTRVVDLLKVAQNRYYHPSQEGSWSIKKVLPAIAPELDYGQLEGVQNGGMAMEAFTEAIADETTLARRSEIENQLLTYCKLDTYAMVRLWQFFSDRTDLKI